MKSYRFSACESILPLRCENHYKMTAGMGVEPDALRVFVTGASGFVGSAVVRELLARGHSVYALSHRAGVKPDDRLHAIRGDMFDPAALDAGIRGCDAVVHLVGIIMERPSKQITFERIHDQGTRNVVDAARRNGVVRYVHMSALGTRPNAASQYHQTKWAAEQYVRASPLEWTIMRPSLIHGPGGFMATEAQWARKHAPPYLVMPYFGRGPLGIGGAGLLQPVYVKDVARAFADALSNPRTIRQTYELAGPDRMTWPQMHHLASEELVGKRRIAAPLPAWWAKVLASAGLGSLLGFSRDQVVMSQEDNVADTTVFERDFGWKPRPMREALREYAGNL